ncbi:hypothetical protein PHYSODRAFT_300825 [Phytophthora sojae]|uniref:Uncharacterized protein n=1 Tax=Phytophthora sojae (strain P6497) TaxID=1094619 RepID=G4ZFK1_PHYSP|nr:hypothetical protein PHYSODRAFT_300825 [Phytophthora sojae]EGZ17938.1 hypothetical protein PHYSODRAFT_300825 [Phytophthora sojae]|eukprot:XP_009526996.1 hypothetical protein PHYSODRAFT_300825 [Phytophthora sojae]
MPANDNSTLQPLSVLSARAATQGTRQDHDSAVRKFEAFLRLEHRFSYDDGSDVDVENVENAGHLKYLSSIRVVVESFVHRKRKTLKKVPPGTAPANRAPMITPEDLRIIRNALFAEKTVLAIKTRTLANVQWSVKGRISDIVGLDFGDIQ